MSGLAYAMFGCENNEKRRISFHLRVIFCYGSSFEQGGLDHAGYGRDYFSVAFSGRLDSRTNIAMTYFFSPFAESTKPISLHATISPFLFT